MVKTKARRKLQWHQRLKGNKENGEEERKRERKKERKKLREEMAERSYKKFPKGKTGAD